MLKRPSFITLVMLILCASTASAQDKGHIGLVMGYPGSAGVLWHVTDRIAVRPTVSFSVASSDQTIALPPIPIDLGLGDLISGAHSTSWQVGFGLNALFYLSRADGLSTYVTPRFSYSRSNIDTEPVLYLDVDSSSSNSSAGGFFGVQYAMNARFAVFGEVGVEYTRVVLPSAVYSTGKITGVRSATDVGVVLYFGK